MRRNQNEKQKTMKEKQKTNFDISDRLIETRLFRDSRNYLLFVFAYPARTLPKAAICSTSAMAISCHTVRDGIHCSLTALRST
jgi:hypothetical protein